MDIARGFEFLFHAVAFWALPFLFVLTVIVFFHELGHYAVGRLCGIKVVAFSIGFGPELLGYTDRAGTRWKLAAIPLGGYVKFLGDENAASVPDGEALRHMSEDERRMAFAAKSVWRRAATVAAGPAANFVLTIAIFAAVAFFAGRQIGDPVVSEVRADSPAAVAGVRAGDRIVALDGVKIEYFNDLIEHVAIRGAVPIAVTVNRGGQQVDLTVTPRIETETDRFGNEMKRPLLGLVANSQSASFRTERLGFVDSLGYGAQQTWFLVRATFGAVTGIFSRGEGADQLGGPIRIAEMSSQAATLGFVAVILFAAQLSVGIGLLNLLPIPMLDGGHLLFYAAEMIRGRPLSERVQEAGFRIGLALVLSLMVFVFWNDIS
ncbi:RIP metalloprotease RseP [Aureimonas leprariae]|uniref:Zinc metalloprotease n=1 Tax=Plantimonas leprariae TaxID=2615207 RepID=A0A7V7TXP8_9HYPH|nr:RIP metalloprotease RseP [Aureimonas leprariae]KAB0681791.1 RIP metalloprotease RseP [Aureimonas leprariae]